jgi:hypothetical protein
LSVTYQPPSKSFTTRDYQFIALAVFLFFFVFSGLVFANLKLTSGGGDFYMEWVGARAFLFDKVDPYSGEVPARVQRMVYPDSLKPGDQPYILDTPFQILPFYYPFALFSDPALARAIFTLFLELALFALAVLALRLTEWPAPRVITILFIFLAAFNFYTVQAIQQGSPVLILGFLYTGILLAFRSELDELTGALLAFSLCYWEVGALFLFFILLRAYDQRRARVFAGFFMVSFILFFISFLSYPYWVIPFLRSVVNNVRADFGFNIHTIFVHIWPSRGGAAAWLFISLLLIMLGYEWSLARSGDERRFYWAACLSIAIAPLLGFRTQLENLAVLLIPLALVLAVVQDRWNRYGNGLVVLLMLLFFVVPWILDLLAVNGFGVSATEIVFLLPPLFTVLGLYWIRWWAIRPPRTWKDLANQL